VFRQARRKQDTEVGVEEVVATVQFSDIENFTGISERVSPLVRRCFLWLVFVFLICVQTKLLITALEEYFQCMTSIIETSGGTVGDYIGKTAARLLCLFCLFFVILFLSGDAIFSFFGVPLSLGPHHALSAVSAAVMMQER
jgi:class 3 adenylate cyclase